MRNNRSRLPEFWIAVLILLSVLSVLLWRVPYGQLIVWESVEFLFRAFRFVVFVLLLGVVFAGPAILGGLNQIYSFKLLEQINPDEDMGGGAIIVIMLICAVIAFVLWGMVVPFCINHNEWLKLFFDEWLGWPTHWEIFPWGWAIWAGITFFIGEVLTITTTTE